MHIAYLTDGHNYHVQKWVRAMADAGITITLITFRPPPTPIPGVTVIQLPIRFGNQERYRYSNFFFSLADVKQILVRIKPDLLLGSYATHYGWLAARTNFHPFVLQTWTLDLTRYPFDGMKRHVFARIVRFTLDRADIITTDGRALETAGRRLYPNNADKLVSVRWGIQLRDFDSSEGSKQQARHTLSVPDGLTVITSPRGVLPVYRPEEVLPGFKKLLATRDDVFVIVLTIEHDRSAHVAKLLADLASQRRALVFDRFLETATMQDIWRATDIVVSVPEADGISESLLESMYAGSYPVMSDIPSNRSLVEEGIIGEIVSDPVGNNLQAKICEVLDRGQELQEARAKNREWVSVNADVKRTAKQMKRLFEKAIDRY
jgi:glycosyltransferase involved in cell wall biosynthesis